MKSIEEFRAHKLDVLRRMIKRPGMWGSPDLEMLTWLGDMCFIDDKLEALASERHRLGDQGRFNSFGVYGPLEKLPTNPHHRQASLLLPQSEMHAGCHLPCYSSVVSAE